jgi:hypothetical protein
MRGSIIVRNCRTHAGEGFIATLHRSEVVSEYTFLKLRLREALNQQISHHIACRDDSVGSAKAVEQFAAV